MKEIRIRVPDYLHGYLKAKSKQNDMTVASYASYLMRVILLQSDLYTGIKDYYGFTSKQGQQAKKDKEEMLLEGFLWGKAGEKSKARQIIEKNTGEDWEIGRRPEEERADEPDPLLQALDGLSF